MNSAEIREAFLNYFESKNHTRVVSSPLVPGNDPTLLFTNAGMVQFKETFLGQESRSYARATSSQRCVRAGGKHNDLENVGYTARHHTFFEMLGNFSFGDYFKREAIGFAWEFLTEVMGLPEDRLWVTVHVSDDEAADIWLKEIGVSAERFSRLDADNFWQMGDTGPCGPSSEIFYDHGANVPGGPPGSEHDDLDRYIEIWNLVFMQYNRDQSGELAPLPSPSVDTGMGLERLAAVMQGVHTNYQIDLFQNLLKAAADILGLADTAQNSLNVIVDHIRSCAFLIVDGVLPSNEGRGYVLRRIVRRAIRHGNKLGATQAFFHKLVAPLVKEMGAAYPELVNVQAQVEKALLAEEEQFAKTLDNGMHMLNEALAGLSSTVIPGDVIFKLYDTYGFPTDLTNDIARERNCTLDMAGYDAAMSKQRQRSKGAGSFAASYSDKLDLEGSTEFTGYEFLHGEGFVTSLIIEGESVEQLVSGERGVVVLDKTPFYGESGGQVGDSGLLTGAEVNFTVENTTKGGNLHLHLGVLNAGIIKLGDRLEGSVNSTDRQHTALNHSATHLLQAALRQVLGEHVAQKGSLVDGQHLRFDFSHFEAVTSAQLKEIERLVNTQIRLNTPVQTELMDMDSAVANGAMALFGEKYGDEVRVLQMGDGFSVELCGGTHVQRTGDIGLMRIVSESGIAAGVRRIEGVTGDNALDYLDTADKRLTDVCAVLKSGLDGVVEKAAALRSENKELEKALNQLKLKLASAAGSDFISDVQDVNGIKVLAVSLGQVDPKSLRVTLDQLKNKMGSGVILLAAEQADKISLVAGVTQDLTDKIKAGDLIKEMAPRIGGKGGGRPDMAQGGGTDFAALSDVLASVPEWVSAQI
jgi:alanyl-tRNA synthetase